MGKRIGVALRTQRENGTVRSEQGPWQFVLWEVARGGTIEPALGGKLSRAASIPPTSWTPDAPAPQPPPPELTQRSLDHPPAWLHEEASAEILDQRAIPGRLHGDLRSEGTARSQNTELRRGGWGC